MLRSRVLYAVCSFKIIEVAIITSEASTKTLPLESHQQVLLAKDMSIKRNGITVTRALLDIYSLKNPGVKGTRYYFVNGVKWVFDRLSMKYYLVSPKLKLNALSDQWVLPVCLVFRVIFNPFNPVLLKAELNAIIRLKKKKTREFEEQ